MRNIYRIGLDVGSTTAKIVVLDNNRRLVFARYERHNAKVMALVSKYIDEIYQRFGDIETKLCVTGSVGMQTKEQLKADFVQEVVAATVFVRECYPKVKTLVDIGGEDAKVVFFNGKSMELRMNGNCAGGTGAFIDQMSVLMGCDNAKMSALAEKARHVYPMAARCGVFAKTDVQNLMSRNLPKSDIAASIFHSIAVQTVTTLSRGCDFTPPILLCGGPLTFLPALRKAFSEYLKIPYDDLTVPENGNLIPAMGCAFKSGDTKPRKLSELKELLARSEQKLVDRSRAEQKKRKVVTGTGSTSRHDKTDVQEGLPPLFENVAHYQNWLKSKQQYATPLYPLKRGVEEVVIGVDSGSTTTKIVAVRMNKEGKGQIVFKDYAMNLGNPIKAVSDGLLRLQKAADKVGADIHIVGSCSTGYGEELIKTAFNLDDGIIETMAHYRAAAHLMPNVSFILDIGGQDMKAIFVENGVVVRMELNEACSSGCGTFIQTFAHNLGYEVEDFARLACNAPNPCDLGTRCTVFMNSKVKQVMREGVTIEDIACGLSYSVVRNCLYKVLKLHGNEHLGNKIVVQGGTMKNDSVVRAFELLTGAKVARGNMPELMGAYGCALNAINLFEQKNVKCSRSIADLLSVSAYNTKLLNCKGCENNCFVTQYTFAGTHKFYSGNKCERIFNNNGKGASKGKNIYVYKYKLLFDRKCAERPSCQRVVGIPRVLNMYEDYPFWHALFTTAGFGVTLSDESTFHRYEEALGSVMSDNICFPAKLVHAHIQELDDKISKLNGDKTGFIFMPYVVYEQQDDNRNINSYNCPIVSAYSDVIRGAMKLRTHVDSPVINFRDKALLKKQIFAYLKKLGVCKSTIDKAYSAAILAQDAYTSEVKKMAEEILADGRANGNFTILLAGRPYHTDPLVQHKLSEMIASLGVNVISEDIVRDDFNTSAGDTYLVKQWAYMSRIIKAGQWCAEQPNDVHFVQMTSFGCGPDSFIQDEVRGILKRHGKPFTLLKIDDVSNIGSLKLRVRSLVESLRGGNKAGKLSAHDRKGVIKSNTSHEEANALPPISRHILAPYFTEYLTPLLPSLCRLFGWDVEVLPPSDSESAKYGLKYANNEVCYPATLIVGDFVKALRSGQYDLDKISVVMTQTGGQCRATNYAALIRRAMQANGFDKVPLITLGVSTSAEEEDKNQSGKLDVPWIKFAPIITTTFLYGDTISKFYHSSVARLKRDAIVVGAKSSNAALALRDKYLNLASTQILKNSPKGLMNLIAQAAEEFDAITEERDVQTVGIVGEIFLKFNPFAHQFLVDKILAKNIEVVPALLSPFFLQNFVNVIVEKQMGLCHSNVPDFIVKSIYSLIWRRQKKINKIASRFRYFRPFTNIFEEAKEVDGIVSLAAQFGEGWLLPSDVISMVKQGVTNVVSLQPFGCIANHIVSKGIEKKLKNRYPQLNLLSLDFDAGVSSVNVTNRLLLFLDSIAV